MDEQIAQCQAPRLGCLQWYAESARKHDAGERQEWCSTCERWKWRDELCQIAQWNEERSRQMAADDVVYG